MLNNALALINTASILSIADTASLDGLRDELIQTWDTVQIFRTRTEMELSVLNDLKHPTPDAKYWQCQREQNVMFQELVSLSYEYRKNDVEIRKAQRDMEAATDTFERELLQIEIGRKKFMAANMERSAHDRMREIRNWHEIKAALLPKLKYGVVDVDRHQSESLPIRFERQAGLVTPYTAVADAQNMLGLHLTAKARAQEKAAIHG